MSSQLRVQLTNPPARGHLRGGQDTLGGGGVLALSVCALEHVCPCVCGSEAALCCWRGSHGCPLGSPDDPTAKARDGAMAWGEKAGSAPGRSGSWPGTGAGQLGPTCPDVLVGVRMEQELQRHKPQCRAAGGHSGPTGHGPTGSPAPTSPDPAQGNWGARLRDV